MKKLWKPWPRKKSWKPWPRMTAFAVACVAVGLVFYFWDGWRTEAKLAAGDNERIARLGQQGDSFGSLNALFTGLGIVGLVYTIILQHHDSELARKTNDRQKREQYLAARLNARSALAQVCSPQGDKTTDGELATLLATEADWDYQVARLRIHILLEEVNFGFDKVEDPIAIEREAILQYCVNRLDKMRLRLAGVNAIPEIKDITSEPATLLLNSLAADFVLLAFEFSARHDELLQITSNFVAQVAVIRQGANSYNARRPSRNKEVLEAAVAADASLAAQRVAYSRIDPMTDAKEAATMKDEYEINFNILYNNIMNSEINQILWFSSKMCTLVKSTSSSLYELRDRRLHPSESGLDL